MRTGRRSLFEIALIFIICYTVIFLFIYEHQTTHLQETSNHFSPYGLLSSFSHSLIAEHAHDSSYNANDENHDRHTHLPLVAHLYINDNHTPISFQPQQKPKRDKNAQSHAIHDIRQFPIIDEYPDGDAYLPWIHDIFPSPL